MTILATLEKTDKEKVKARMRVPFIGFLLFMCVFATATLDVPDFVRSIKADRWPVARGIIKRSDLDYFLLGKEPAWTPVLDYTYEIDGKQYVGYRIKFQKDWGLPGYEAHKAKEVYVANSVVAVRYDPNDPTNSCVVTAPSLFRVINHFLMCLLFAALIYLSTYPVVAPE